MGTASAQSTIAILNGPNLNLLGTREPEIYGSETLGDIEAKCRAHIRSRAIALRFEQSNSEGGLVDLVQASRDCSAVIINAAGYTHTSVALLDALKALPCPAIEVHLSHPAAREPFRHHSVIAPACKGVIAGFGALSYLLALDAAAALLDAPAT
ncbi:MAG: type II 3-dehydroquinate dehydratase [Pseudomonadota bacterium]